LPNRTVDIRRTRKNGNGKGPTLLNSGGKKGLSGQPSRIKKKKQGGTRRRRRYRTCRKIEKRRVWKSLNDFEKRPVSGLSNLGKRLRACEDGSWAGGQGLGQT